MRKHDLDKWLEEFDEEEVGADTAAPAAVSVAPPQASRPDAELSPLWTPDEATEPTSDLAGRLLSRTVITPNQLEQARNLLKQSPGKRLADVLIDMGVDETEVQQEVAFDRGIPFERIDPQKIEERYFHRLGADYCKVNGVMPLRDSGSRVVLGVTDPRKVFMLDEVRRKLHKPVKLVLVTQSDIMAVMENFTDEQVTDVAIDDIIKDIEEDDVEVVEAHDDDMDIDLAKEAGESPVIRFVNYLIYDAVKNGASDIHIEPQEKKLRIRYRIDGILFEMMNPPHTMHAAIVSRLKIMANLDISERRLPQDGRVRAVVNGRKLDLRLSTLPTGAGEKAVMRILDSRAAQVGLDELGMPETTLDLWKKQIAQPHGIILVTGPTGSGKTTTLYGSLGQMDRSKLNISTVEDPIEYQLSGLTQVQTHESIGMTFAAALRSLLRQDPDVVMVGEIRDEETARIAIQAAMTGHLVLSTLHTNDAPASITRLINIGVEPYLIGAAINAVLAQRLVRRICEHCREQSELDETTAEHLAMHGVDPSNVMAGAGCERCHQTGYSGRVGLYELLVLDDSIRDAIAGNPTVTELRRQCIDRGMVTLRMDGFSKVGEGRTTVEEVLRVTQGTI
ncbi:MAG: ATPase, T2SS/T4P/T4SS family [Phycisphaerae bacterium]|nr:ATPase, T2SS/T4P/T4SS family [Phycisphaerae bacterium]